MTHYQNPPRQPSPVQDTVPKPNGHWTRTWLVAGGVGLLALIVGVGIGTSGQGSNSTTASTGTTTVTTTVTPKAGLPQVRTVPIPGPTVTVTKTEGPKVYDIIPEGGGTFEVGVDIKPGKYKTSGGDGCYWARMNNLSGDLDGIIANDNVSGPATVVIKKTDKAFQTNDCAPWARVG